MGLRILVGVAFLSVAWSWAWADSPPGAPTASFSRTLNFGEQPSPAEEPTPTPEPEERGALMELLNRTQFGQALEKWNINIFGHVEGSYTWNFDQPANDINELRFFDFEHDKPLLNRIDLTVERLVDPTKKQFDIGGRMEWLWGADAGLLHANGLFDWYDSERDPENQFDLLQAYVDVALPVGNGLLLRAGKFVTTLGYEDINPTQNTLYSHSFLFTFSEPSTQTGILATYILNDAWSITGGITRGWDQATEDNNGAIDFLGGVEWTPNDKLSMALNLSIGPQRDNDNEDYRTLLCFYTEYSFTDAFSLAFDTEIGWDPHAAADGDTAHWYGVAIYPSYQINDHLALNGRVEWFRDEEGFTTGVAGNFYEATIGLGIRPFPKDRWAKNLLIRPELRGDWSSHDIFDGGEDDSQYTAAVDVLITF